VANLGNDRQLHEGSCRDTLVGRSLDISLTRRRSGSP
jgi:hypothetical protein